MTALRALYVSSDALRHLPSDALAALDARLFVYEDTEPHHNHMGVLFDAVD